MGRIKVYNSYNRLYIAKHPDYPLFEIDGTICEVKTTEKIKQKHIKEVLEDQELLNEVVDETGIEMSELVAASENRTLYMRKETKCPYRGYIGPRVFKALGDYERPLLSTFGVWVPKVEFVGGVACLMLHLLTLIIPIVYLFIGANFVSLPFALKMAHDDSRPLMENL